MLSVFMRLGKNLVKGKIKHNSSQHNLFKSGMQETVYLVTFTEEILNEKLHFLWSAYRRWNDVVCLLSCGSYIFTLQESSSSTFFLVSIFSYSN